MDPQKLSPASRWCRVEVYGHKFRCKYLFLHYHNALKLNL